MIGQLIAGRYEVEELLGTGGMSSVFRARDLVLEREVAVKLLHEHYAGDHGYVERFRREARSAARLSHPGIVTVIDRGEQAGRQFIVFEYVEGETLKELVERVGPLPVRRALEIGLEVGRALAFAHRRGLVHRDVKPQNVLLSESGQAKVADFGIARVSDSGGLTETGTVLGTSDYIAPEQASGGHVGPQTDVYSLGAVLYEALTGEVPFPGGSVVAVALRHVSEPVPSVAERRPDVPLRLSAAIERAMAKDPARRFRSMDEFVVELEGCLADLGQDADRDATAIMRAPRVERRRRAPRRRRRAGLLLPLALALGALAAAIAVLALRGFDGSQGGSEERVPGPAISLRAVGSYDPEGDEREHDEAAPYAVDGDADTYWTTETYDGFSQQKSGVGLVLDAGRTVEPSRVTVRTDTPGFTVEIRAGPSPTGPFEEALSDPRKVGRVTRFDLREDARLRYFAIWITELPGDTDSRAHVNEVRLA